MSTVMDAAEAQYSELEERAGVPAREPLLARKREIMKELAPLRAMHRSNGQGSPADSARKRHRALIAKQILAALRAKDSEAKEPSEAALERMANAHEDHIAFCEKLARGAERYEILSAEVEELDYRLRARETELNCYRDELRLAR